MKLIRFLNTAADCYTALRLAGWSADEASRIVTEEATKVINAIPSKPYPDYKDQLNDHGNRNPNDPNDAE